MGNGEYTGGRMNNVNKWHRIVLITSLGQNLQLHCKVKLVKVHSAINPEDII
jgi:hypothetical protein